MSGANTAKASTGINSLTPREGEILAKAWACLKTGPPEIDYEKLAGECGMSNHRSAANAWSAIKKKMAWSTSGVAGAGRATTARATKRKKTAGPTNTEDTDEGEGEGEEPSAKKTKATPKKAPGTISRKKTAAAMTKARFRPESSDDEDDDEDESADDKNMKAEETPSGSGAAERPIKNEPEPDVESDGT